MIATQLIAGGSFEERIKTVQKTILPFWGHLVDFDNPPVDILIIKPNGSIGIDQTRNLKRFLSQRPYQAKMKIVLIFEAEKLTLPAQNSLLKTLEEPPGHSLIILLASQSESLLSTIISRAKITRLPAKSKIRLSKEEINQLIKTLDDLLILGVGERLKLSFSLAKNKDQTLVLTENFLFLWRYFLLIKTGVEKEKVSLVKKLNLEQIEKAIKNTEQVRKMLVANVNFHLAIENLLLSYPFLKLVPPSEK